MYPTEPPSPYSGWMAHKFARYPAHGVGQTASSRFLGHTLEVKICVGGSVFPSSCASIGFHAARYQHFYVNRTLHHHGRTLPSYYRTLCYPGTPPLSLFFLSLKHVERICGYSDLTRRWGWKSGGIVRHCCAVKRKKKWLLTCSATWRPK